MKPTMIWRDGRIEQLEIDVHAGRERAVMVLRDEVVRLLIVEAIEAIGPVATAGTLPKIAGAQDGSRLAEIELSDAIDRIKKAMNNLGIARSRIRALLKRDED